MNNSVKIIIAIVLVVFFSWAALFISCIEGESANLSEVLQYYQCGALTTILVILLHDKMKTKEK